MSFRNRDTGTIRDLGSSTQGHQSRRGRARTPRSLLRAPRRSRRGVLLLVVLSLLVLFMLIGTAFLMSSNQYKTSATASARFNRVGNPPTKLLDRALMQVLCDTGNPGSVIRYHSLLRDMYGSDGLEAMVFSPIDGDLDSSGNFSSGNLNGQITRYATPTTGAPPTSPLGPTQGQLIDIYVREHAFQRDDRLIFGSETQPTVPDARNIIKLERSVLGLPEMYNMPLTKGYFNGCTLTITSGPARGQSTRIVEYDYIGDFPTNQNASSAPQPFPSKLNTRLFRFRVLAFPNANGEPLRTRSQLPANDPRYSNNAARGLEIADLVAAEERDNGNNIVGTTGATFIVNGRPFSGTGAGFNQLARAGDPRLNVVETVGFGTDPTKWLYPEVALAPNSRYFFAADPANPTNAPDDVWGARYFDPTKSPPNQYPALNPTPTSGNGSVPFPSRPLLWKYQNFAGPGDADESYDAPDFQNMALAMQTVTPRAIGRVVQGATPQNPTYLDADDPTISSNLFLRLDLEDLPIPSYHRPDLENYWFHRLMNFAITVDGASPDDAAQAVIAPYGVNKIRGDGDDPSVSLNIRDQIVALKRKISLRPLGEDHPNFDGNNPASRPPNLQNANGPLTRNGNIAIPFWEAVGPWDVDNDGDGIPDSVWVDLGDPVQQADDGTLYKPLYALLIVDLDSRLNVNAHGLVEHFRTPTFSTIPNPNFDPTVAPGPANPKRIQYRNLANDLSLGSGLYTSDYLPAGSGYGPAEISLRPLFSQNLPGNANATLASHIGNPAYDDYARLLVGRPDFDGRPAVGKQPSVWGRHGSVNVRGNAATDWTNNAAAATATLTVRPGIPYNGAIPEIPWNPVPPPGFIFIDPAYADRLALFKFFGYPLWPSDVHGDKMQAPLPTVRTAFSSPPDLQGRFAIGLGYEGQPVDEVASDAYLNANSQSLLVDTPYELDLSESRRRDAPDEGVASAIIASPLKHAALNDDAPFATADLERVLRACDADSGILPDRLWTLVDAFDPLKLTANQPALVQAAALRTFGTSSPSNAEAVAAAQQIAAVNRRLVTTDSYDVPVPSNNFLKRLIYGADGQPGVAGVNDNPGSDSVTDDSSELGWQNSDDWYAVMYHQPTVDNPTPFNASGAPTPATGIRLEPQNPTIVDLLRYRVQFERRKRGVPLYTEAELTAVTQQLLAPEILAGGKMDLNRPFGDGRDNGDGIDNDGNGLIDDNYELESNLSLANPDRIMNGIVDDPLEAGEPFVDHDPDGTGPLSGNGKWEAPEEWVDFDGNGVYTPPRDQLWAGITSEPIGFSHNHGGVTTDGRWYDFDGDGALTNPKDGRLRYNGIIQRQTFARHLYCLMMLLVDENYVASQNVAANAEGNVNLQFFFRELWSQMAYELAAQRGRAPRAPDLVPSPIQQDFTDAQPLAEQLALRKLTARRIAQWAINTVDFRDADSEMTPFEYDENPFDGWGLFDRNNRFVPVDGDPGTNENWGGVNPFKVYPTRFNRTVAVDPTNNPQDDATAVNSTRAVVWGTERPELLITETLALHDRRCTDEQFPNNSTISPPQNPPDYDLDQRLKPRGALYLELYNPWSDDGERPADLYGRDRTSNNPSQGVMLNRLSSIGVSTSAGTKRSPVWRVAVVQDPVNGRLTNQIIDISSLAAPNGADDRQALASQFLTTDASGFGFDSDQDAERLVYFTTGRDYTTGNGSDPDRSNDNLFLAEYTNIPNKTADPNCPNLNVWVPPLPYRDRTSAGLPQVRTAKRYFIARTERNPGLPNDTDVPIAPILPGRYAVVGPSGLQLDATGQPISYTGTTPRAAQQGDRYVLPLSRLLAAAGGQPDQVPDKQHNSPTPLAMTRRIELWPSVNPDSPLVPNTARPAQLLVAENAGPEIVSDRNGNFRNVTDANNDNIPDATVVDSPVAIPVEDLNISEPVEAYLSTGYGFRDGYPTERYIQLFGESQSAAASPTGTLNIVEAKLNDGGELEYDPPYDRPLDMEAELIRNGTTQNYRSVHLQRLANPMFPWNPPAFDDRGVANAMHRAHLPVNPYITIDSQSTDLTAYNGASAIERSQLPYRPSTPDPNDPETPADDLLQGDYFAPLSAAEYIQAPDHVLAGLISVLASETPPIVDPWRSVEEYRGTGSPDDIARIANDLDTLERQREGDTAGRAQLTSVTEWGWHRLRRTLPDDLDVATQGLYAEEQFKQRLNFKSLERGAHYQSYYKYPQAGTPEGWWFDTNWTPRLLWKQERPNTMLFLRNNAGATVRVTDMKNVRSRRQLRGTIDGRNPRPEDFHTQDDERKANYLNATTQMPDHVLNFALEHTLGFVNESYAPDLDRAGGRDENAMLMADPTPVNSDPKPGAPEVATDPNRLVAPQPEELNRWNTLTPQQVLIQPQEELQRRQRLMHSTFPWFAWNNRPFTSAAEITQVSASSPSLMLREYSVASRNTANPYDGDGRDGTNPETVVNRLARQQGAFGHLLNFFQTAEMPAGTFKSATGVATDPLAGGPNFYRIFDFVEVPSKYVGTDTLLSPEIFNDAPVSTTYPTEPVGTDITALDDPRILLQPPFNKVSRQRDPGRVNLNTVTGRRRVESNGFIRHWSEVYDGIMHRYGDSNLLDSANNVLQLSHFGPAWRDVALSRKGYAQFNADNPNAPVEKVADTQVEPDTFAFGLNHNFPSIFSNPFRSADAGDLVPLANMVRPGVESTLHRGIHWQRAFEPPPTNDDVLITNPFSTRTAQYNQIAWGVVGVDDDGNGLVDDIREAGYGAITNPPTVDGDTLRVRPSLNGALEGSGIPLFSEQVPVPAIDGERNPGMMYQPMTRLGNLVTTRSNVYAIWITVGYFEVERAPDFADQNVQRRFGGDGSWTPATTNPNAATVRARALYDRVYPEGYTLGEELGTDTGNTNRQRAFYIIDRTEPVGFKPGEDLNVDKMIRVRRRIE